MLRGKLDCARCGGTGVIYYGHCSAMHAVTCNCAYEKPHLTPSIFRRGWVCTGRSVVTHGATPREAYQRWAAA